jgi:hypothetical protein
VSGRNEKANRDAKLAAKELRKRQELIKKFKPRCPDCGEDFTAEQHVNQCVTCKYFICDGCTETHRCKGVQPREQPRIVKP